MSSHHRFHREEDEVFGVRRHEHRARELRPAQEEQQELRRITDVRRQRCDESRYEDTSDIVGEQQIDPGCHDCFIALPLWSLHASLAEDEVAIAEQLRASGVRCMRQSRHQCAVRRGTPQRRIGLGGERPDALPSHDERSGAHEVHAVVSGENSHVIHQRIQCAICDKRLSDGAAVPSHPMSRCRHDPELSQSTECVQKEICIVVGRAPSQLAVAGDDLERHVLVELDAIAVRRKADASH